MLKLLFETEESPSQLVTFPHWMFRRCCSMRTQWRNLTLAFHLLNSVVETSRVDSVCVAQPSILECGCFIKNLQIVSSGGNLKHYSTWITIFPMCC